MHAYIHVYVRTYERTYICTHMHARMHIIMQTYIDMYTYAHLSGHRITLMSKAAKEMSTVLHIPSTSRRGVPNEGKRIKKIACLFAKGEHEKQPSYTAE